MIAAFIAAVPYFHAGAKYSENGFMMKWLITNANAAYTAASAIIILPGFEIFRKTRTGGRNAIEMNAEYENASSTDTQSEGLYAAAKEIIQDTRNDIRAAAIHVPTRPSIAHRAAIPSIPGISPGTPACDMKANMDATTTAAFNAAKNLLLWK